MDNFLESIDKYEVRVASEILSQGKTRQEALSLFQEKMERNEVRATTGSLISSFKSLFSSSAKTVEYEYDSFEQVYAQKFDGIIVISLGKLISEEVTFGSAEEGPQYLVNTSKMQLMQKLVNVRKNLLTVIQ